MAATGLFKGHTKLVLSVIVTGLSLYTFTLVLDKWPARENWEIVFDEKHLAPFVLYTCILSAVNVLRAIRWRRLLSDFILLPYAQSIATYFWCFLLNAFLPYRLGEVTRVVWVKKFGGSLLSALGVQIVERTVDLMMVLAIGAATILALPQFPFDLGQAAIVFLCAFVVAGLLFLWKAPLLLQFALYLEARYRNVLFKYARVLTEGLVTISRRGELGPQLLLTLLIWVGLGVGNFVFLGSFFPNWSFESALFLIAALALASILPAAPGNLGVFEAACVLVLTSFGVDKGDSVVAAIALHSADFVAALVGGLVGRAAILLSSQRPNSF